MLIEFRVKNYRSFREEQNFSLVASNDHTFDDSHVINTNVSAAKRLLRSAAIYGPNASGKSNLVNAMAFMRSLVATSATQIREGQSLNTPAFKLDPATAELPSEFEITFVIDGIRHQYGFQVNSNRITEEWLYVYKTAKPQKWFHRVSSPKSNSDTYDFSSYLIGQRKTWQEATRSNALFLSTAVQLNSEALRPIFLWLVENLEIVGAAMQPSNDQTDELIKTDNGKLDVLNFMNAADLSISDLSFEKREGKRMEFGFDGDKPIQSLTKIEITQTKVHHVGESGSAIFELAEESLGTQRLFAFAGLILHVLKLGKVLVVDEFDGSLHPLMMKFLINLFHSKDTNLHNAQLIFTTHNTSLLDMNVFRRDQIWLVEKDHHMASNIRPLSDFSPRKNEAFEHNYLTGRYGALPFITEFKS